jgi:hypothetical protein
VLAKGGITKLVKLVSEIAERRLNVPVADGKEIEEMKQMVAAEAVLDAIEEGEDEPVS